MPTALLPVVAIRALRPWPAVTAAQPGVDARIDFDATLEHAADEREHDVSR